MRYFEYFVWILFIIGFLVGCRTMFLSVRYGVTKMRNKGFANAFTIFVSCAYFLLFKRTKGVIAIVLISYLVGEIVYGVVTHISGRNSGSACEEDIWEEK